MVLGLSHYIRLHDCVPNNFNVWYELKPGKNPHPVSCVLVKTLLYQSCLCILYYSKTQIYVFGGRQRDSKHSQSVFVYGTKSKSWQTLTDMPQICNFGCAVVWKDRIYIVGGLQRSCMCYNPVRAQWSTLSQCRHQHADAPALVWKDRILVCGGRSSKAKRDNGTAGGTSVIEEYDPETDTWTVSQIELPQRLNAHFVFNIGTLILT